MASPNRSNKDDAVSNYMPPATNSELSKLLFRKNAETGQTNLSRDAKYACQLLAINPQDLLPRSYGSFSERGLDEVRQKLRFQHHEDKRQLKTRAVENVLISCNTTTQEGQIAQALMEEVKRSKSTLDKGKIPRFPNGRSNSLKPAHSNTQLNIAMPSMTGLNNTLGQGMITAQIGNQASELMKLQQQQQRFANVSPFKPDAASYQQVLAFKIQRASGKLQKWDQMSQKITEMSEIKKQKAQQKELQIQAKLEKIQKNKEDYWTYQTTVTKQRLQKWQTKREVFDKKISITEKKRMNQSHLVSVKHEDELDKRRTLQDKVSMNRHNQMAEKLKLEKLNLANRNDYLQNQTFEAGQSLYSDKKQRQTLAGLRKTDSITKLVNRQMQHSEVVFDKMEQSLLAEEERKQNALWNTEEAKVNFLQRLEQQNKDKTQDLEHKFGRVAQRNTEVKLRQATDKKRLDRRRLTVEKKYQKQDDQVKLANDRSMSQIQFQAEKRKLIKDVNEDAINRSKRMKFDQDAVKLYKHELKKQQRGELAQRIHEANNVTTNHNQILEEIV